MQKNRPTNTFHQCLGCLLPHPRITHYYLCKWFSVQIVPCLSVGITYCRRARQRVRLKPARTHVLRLCAQGASGRAAAPWEAAAPLLRAAPSALDDPQLLQHLTASLAGGRLPGLAVSIDDAEEAARSGRHDAALARSPSTPPKTPQIPTDSRRSPQIPTDSHSSPTVPTDPQWFPQIPTDSHRFPQIPTGSRRSL